MKVEDESGRRTTLLTAVLVLIVLVVVVAVSYWLGAILRGG